jgi:DNA-binding FrmR family transcriptional regulator
MPERVKKLEGQILGLSSQIEDLRSDVSRLVQVLKEAITPKENYSSPLKDEKYIS